MRNWVNYGDVSPLQHGGLWVEEDKDSKNCFYVIEVGKLPSDVEKNGYYLNNLYVDLSCDWIKWDDVEACMDLQEDDDISKLLAVVNYYNYLEFGEQYVIHKDNIVEELEKYDIEAKMEDD